MTRGARAGAAGVLVALGLVVAGRAFDADASSRSPSAADERLQPSGEGLPFDPGRYRDFDDYVLQTRERLERHKVYMDSRRAGRELVAATPFERAPAAGCPPAATGRPSRGVLLLHGLSDMPLAMRDLADAFAARCFVVRAMLLPGHGTRAGDLLDVTRGESTSSSRRIRSEPRTLARSAATRPRPVRVDVSPHPRRRRHLSGLGPRREADRRRRRGRHRDAARHVRALDGPDARAGPTDAADAGAGCSLRSRPPSSQGLTTWASTAHACIPAGRCSFPQPRSWS